MAKKRRKSTNKKVMRSGNKTVTVTITTAKRKKKKRT
jgi:hypothetical protein